MLIKWENITSTARLLKIAREWKMYIIVKWKLMFKTLSDNYNKNKVKWIWKPLRWLDWDIAIYRADTLEKSEVKRINRYLKNNPHWKVYYNSLWINEILET